VARGCYDVSRIENDMDFSMYEDIEDENSIPDNQRLLRLEIEKTLIVLKTLFKDDSQSFEHYFEQLLSLAKAGLSTEIVTPKMANEALLSLKNEIVSREGGKIKNNYLKHMGKTVGKFATIMIVIVIIINCFINWSPEYLYYTSCLIWENYFIMLIGASAGAWASLCVRKIEIRFEDLIIMEEDGLEPEVQIAFVAIMVVMVGLLFQTGAIFIKIGNTSLDMFQNDSRVALLLGLLLGYCSKALATKISEQVNGMLKF